MVRSQGSDGQRLRDRLRQLVLTARVLAFFDLDLALFARCHARTNARVRRASVSDCIDWFEERGDASDAGSLSRRNIEAAL
jgi:hypothetical protein